MGIYYFNNKSTEESTVVQNVESEQLEAGDRNFAKHEDDDLRLSFEYQIAPVGYTLIESEKNENDSEDFVKGITLLRTTDYEDMQSGPDRGGPPSINIRVFDNTGSNLETWMTANTLLTNDQGVQEEIEVDGKEAIHYSWEGMFDGETVVIQNGDYIYMFEGTYHTNTEDTRQQEFKDLLDSVSFN